MGANSCPSESIAGRVNQFDLMAIDAFPKSPLRRSLADYFRSLLEGVLGVRPANPKVKLKHVAPKLLVAPPGHGLQAVHWDAHNGLWDKVQRFSVVFYLTAGAQTTALPRWPAAAFQPIEYDQPSLQSFAPLLSREYFHSVAAFPGDVMIFSQRVPHFGTANPAAHPRQALFSMFSPYASPSQDAAQVRPICTRALPVPVVACDAYASAAMAHNHSLLAVCSCCGQLYRWRYMQEAYGDESREWAESLVADAACSPLSRFRGHDDFELACLCLRRHGLVAQYMEGVGNRTDATAVRLALRLHDLVHRF